MFRAPMGRFQIELINYFTYFSTVVLSNSCGFFPVGISSLIQHFQQVLWVLKSWLGQLAVVNERPTGKKHTTFGWDDGGKIGKIIS